IRSSPNGRSRADSLFSRPEPPVAHVAAINNRHLRPLAVAEVDTIRTNLRSVRFRPGGGMQEVQAAAALLHGDGFDLFLEQGEVPASEPDYTPQIIRDVADRLQSGGQRSQIVILVPSLAQVGSIESSKVQQLSRRGGRPGRHHQRRY